MNARWIIVDGYSLLHRHPQSGSRTGTLLTARHRLVRQLEEVAGSLAERFTVVFDGTARGGREGYESASIEVVFSPADKTADTVIERLHPRLESSPQVLFAAAPTLPPGNYRLHWTVVTIQGTKAISGDIPFQVTDQ